MSEVPLYWSDPAPPKGDVSTFEHASRSGTTGTVRFCSPEMLDEMFPDGVCDAGTFSAHRSLFHFRPLLTSFSSFPLLTSFLHFQPLLTRCFRMACATLAPSSPTGAFPLRFRPFPISFPALLPVSFPALFFISGPSSYLSHLHFRPLSSFPAPLDEKFPDGGCDAGNFFFFLLLLSLELSDTQSQ